MPGSPCLGREQGEPEMLPLLLEKGQQAHDASKFGQYDMWQPYFALARDKPVYTNYGPEEFGLASSPLRICVSTTKEVAEKPPPPPLATLARQKKDKTPST